MRFSWESFDGLLSRAKEKIEKIFPVAGERYTLQASNLRWENTGEDIYSDPALHKDYKIKGKTLAARLIGTFKIYDNATKKLVDAESAYPILSIPHLTSKRSFLVNGKEIQIVNQIRLKPGTYTRYTADNNVETFVNAPGGGYRVMLDRVKSVFRLRIGQSTYVHLLPILKGLGIDEDAIKKAWGDDVFAANKAKDNPDDMAKLYAKMRPYYSAPVEKEELNTAVKDFFASKRLDPSITRLTLGTAYKNITPETLLDSSARALKLSQGSIEEDDTENLAYKSIHSTDDFVLEKLDQQIEASTRRIAYMVDRRPKVIEAIPPRMFTEPVMRFFSTSEFSRYSDQNNPLDMLGVDSLVTTMGEGGLKSMHSVTDDLRALHPSHVGVLDPIHTSEACFDAKTEVMTDTGWIPWPKATKDMRFACLIDGRLEFQAANEMFVFDHDGPMYGFKSTLIEYLVTGHHRMWCRPNDPRSGHGANKIRRSTESMYRFEEASAIHGKVRHFRSSGHKPYEGILTHEFSLPKIEKQNATKTFPAFFIDDWATFLGWYLSEGNPNGKYVTQISQSSSANPEKVLLISETLNAMAISWSYNVKARGFAISGKQLRDYLVQFGNSGSKFIPEEAFHWPVSARRCLFNALMQGDGTAVGDIGFVGCSHYTTSSHRLALDVERLCFGLGLSSKLVFKPDSRSNYGGYWAVNIHVRKERKVAPKLRAEDSVQRIRHYKGKVFCASVPGGLLYCRRGEGHGCWYGNSKIGITNHLTLGARKMGTDLGLTVIDAKTGKRVEKRVVDLEDKVVAFNDQYDFSKGKPRALVHDLKVRSQGKFITTAAAKVDYIFDAPAKMFGIVANAIPFLHNDSPNRALMATRHMEQAVPLKNPDVPSVQARFGAGGYESVLGKLLAPNSPVDGKVTKVKAAEITILGNDKKTYTVQLHQYYPLNSNAFLHEVPIVKAGDLVKKNQTIADSDFTRKGDLAIGRTLRTAFLPYKGQNFEDGFVVSEGAADKLTSVHKHEMRLDLDATITTGLSKLLAYFPATAEGVDRSKFDAAGLLKKGVILHNGELAIPGVRKITVHEEFDYTKLHKSLTNQWQDVSVRWDGDAPAEVIDVVKTRGFISIYVRTEEKLEIGDKISIRHGGKGIVCNILPDKEMYRDEKGNVIDVLFNPACYDESTEILTVDGWKRISSVKKGDPVISKDPATGVIREEFVRKKFSYDYSGPMYRIKNKVIDLLVTPNHRMWTRKWKLGKWGFDEAKDIFGERRFYDRAGEWLVENEPSRTTLFEDALKAWNKRPGFAQRGPRPKVVSLAYRDWVAFLGYFVTEGWTHKTKSYSYQVGVCQSIDAHPGVVIRIDALMKRLPFSFHRRVDDKGSVKWITSNRALYEWLRANCGRHSNEKRLPQDILRTSNQETLRMLMGILLETDGNTRWNLDSGHYGSKRYFSTSHELMGQVQEIALKTGSAGNLVQSTNPSDAKRSPCYTVSVSEKLNPRVNWSDHTKSVQVERWEHYEGKIFCVEVPSHLVFVRRNGKPVWCGNSVLGRINPGTLFESAAGKVAEKTGKTFLVDNFTNRDSIGTVQKALKDNGLSDLEGILDPTTNKVIPDVTVGNLHFVKLRHQVSKKLSARGITSYAHDESPAHSKANENPMAIGTMELYSLLAGGGTAFLRDATTLKCLPWNAQVETEFGPFNIAMIVNNKMGMKVKSMGPGGEVVWRSVTDHFKYRHGPPSRRIDGCDHPLVDVMTPVIAPGTRRRTPIRATENHELMTRRGKVQIKDLDEKTDELAVIGPALTPTQKSVLTGTLLGDACIVRHARLSLPALDMRHKKAHQEYLLWKMRLLPSLTWGVPYDTWSTSPGTGKRCPQVAAHSSISPALLEFEKKFYEDRHKGVPRDKARRKKIDGSTLEFLDDRAVAIMFMDDGTTSCQPTKKDHRGAVCVTFCIGDTTSREAALLAERFQDLFGINATWTKKVGGNQRLLYVTGFDAQELLFRIAPFVHPVFRYKMKAPRRSMEMALQALVGSKIREMEPVVQVHDEAVYFVPFTVRPTPKRSRYTSFVYDITVEDTHNYIVSGVVVGNSSKNDEYWRALQLGLPLPPLKTPFIVDKFVAYMRGAGINLKQEGTALKALPLTDKDIMAQSNGEITSPGVVKANDLSPEDGGLFDKALTGGFAGNYWNHIVLADPLPNPLMDQAITSLLGTPSKPFRKAEFEGLIEGNLFVTKDGKVTTESVGNKTGGEALKFLLSKVDVDKDTMSLRQQVRTLRGAPRDNAVKKLRYLRALKSMNMSPVEAYINTKIPIIPAKMRPIYPNPDGTLNVADPVHGYREVLLVNNQIKDLKKLGVDDKNLGKLRGDLYKAVCGLVGIQEPLTRSENFKGFIQTIKGPQNKYGLFQGRVLKRRQDLTGRSTIIPDPKLGLDEIKLPEDMAFVIYQPFIVNQLRAVGYPPLKARELIEAKDPAARAALEAVMRERPVLFNRAPSLHKFSLMSFKPQLSKGKAIEMNPLVVTGYSCVGRIPIREDGRFRIVDLEDFPHGDAIIGEDSAYSVPESVEVLTYVENGFEWKHPDRYYIHKDLKGVKVTVGKNRKVVVSESHSLYCFDPEKGECRRMPPSEALGKATPRLTECRISDRVLESIVGPDGSYFPLTTEFGWWLGAVIGDGWASFARNQPKGVCLSGSITSLVLKEWSRLSGKIFGILPGKPNDRDGATDGAWGAARKLTLNSGAMTSWLAPMIGRGAANKHLPDFVWSAPDEFCLGLVAGLMDTDGHVGLSKTGRTNMTFSTKSEALAEHVVWLLSRFGVDANFTKRTNNQGRDYWVVNPSISDFHGLGVSLIDPNKRGALKLLDLWPANDHFTSDVIPILKAEAEGLLTAYVGTRATSRVNKDLAAAKEYSCLRRALETGLIGRVALAEIVIRIGRALVPQALMDRFSSSIKWDRVTSIMPDTVQDMYDLRVPGGTYTFVLSNKLTVFDSADFDGDAMQVHVPVSEAAREEAMTKLLPSKNLFSPRDNSVLNAPSKEMLLGVYLMTTPKGDPKPAASLKEVMGLYEHRTIAANTAMTVKGRVICPGQIIFNEALPQEFRKDFESVTTSKLMVIIAEIANKKPAIAGDIISKIKDLGNRYVTEIGYSFGLRDLHFPTVERDKIMADAAVDAKKRGFMAAYGDASKKMQAAVKTKVDNRIVIGGPISGAFGKSDEITQTIASPVAVKDHTGKVIEIPIMRSYAEGMDSGSYWTMIPGSRKGLMDRALSTGDTGTFSKHLLAATVDTVISEMDCGTTEGLTMPVTEPEALDRVIASGPYKGKILDTKLSRMLKAKGKDTIVVRSPLRCKSHRGMCSRCFGLLENGQFPQIGYHIGALAGQTISEPAMQLTMRCSAGLVHTEDGIIPFSAFFDRSTVLFQEDDFEVATPACDVVDRTGVVKTGLVERHLPHDDMYLVKTRSGAAVLVQGNHPMWVLPCAIRPGSSNRRVQIIGENKYRCTSTFYRDFSANEAELAPEMIVKQARDITMEDAVWVDYRPLLGGSHVPALDPYLAGFFAAEGCFRVGNGTKKYKGISVATIFSVSSHTPWFKAARKRLEPLLSVEHSEGQRAYTVYGLEYARKIDRVVGYSGEHTSHNKVLRADVASLSPRWAQEFLEGYIDGDGCVFESSGVTVAKTTSTSWELTSQIIALCKKLGAHPSVSATDDAPSRLLQWHTSFNIEIRFPKGFTPIRSFKLGIVRPMKHTKKAICGFDPVCLVKKLTRWKGYVYDVKTDTEGFMAGPIHNHNSFHTGGSIGSSNIGYPRIKQILEMPANVRGKAILSMQPGTVKSIAPSAAGGWNVDVDGMNHFVPMEQGLGVKKGQKVEAGQLLSTGGAVTPQDVLAATNDIRKVQDQMIGEIGGIYRQSNINIKRRIFEAAIQPLTNRAEVSDPGDADVEFGINVGDVKSINILDDFNNQLKKKGKRPILFVPTLLSIKTAPSYAEDFIGQMIAERPHQTLKNAPSLAATSNIGPSGHPIATYAFGRFFGDKVEDHKKKTASEVGQEIQDLSTLLVEPEEEKPPEFTEDVNKMLEELRDAL